MNIIRNVVSNSVMTHEKYLEKTAHSKFKPGSLCWARLDATRVWPATVTDPSPEDLLRYPRTTQVVIFVNFLVVDCHAFVSETDIWEYKTGAEMFAKTNAARNEALLTQAVSKLKGLSESPSAKTAHNENNEPGCSKVDIYEFHNEDALSSDEQITPFSQAGRKTNSAIQDLQTSQLNYLEPKVVLERHVVEPRHIAEPRVVLERNIGDEYFQKDKSVNTSGKDAKNEANANMKKIKQKGKKTKGKGKAKQLPEEKTEEKVKKRKTEKKLKVPVENTEKMVKKSKTEKKVKEPVENMEKIVKKRKTEQEIKEPGENTEKIVKRRKVEKKNQIEVPEEKAEEEPKHANVEKKVESEIEEKSTAKSRSGRALRKIEPFQVKPKERKERRSPEKREKKKMQLLKVKIQRKKKTHTAESVFFPFEENRDDRELNISLLNFPDEVQEMCRQVGIRQEPCGAKFGFMGLGTFGRNLAMKLLLSLHKVYLWDKAEWKQTLLLQELSRTNISADASVLFKSSPVELVKECDIIILCQANFHAIEFLLHENRGFLPLLKGKGVLNFTTLTAFHSEYFRRRIMDCGGWYLSVGLFENSEEPHANKFNAVVSGEGKLVAKALTCLSIIANKIYYLNNSPMAVDVAKLLDVLPPSFSVTCASLIPLLKSYNLEPSSLLTSKECTRHLGASIVNNRGGFQKNAHSFNNYLSPKVISERMEALMNQVKKSYAFPMLETLNEMYKVCKE